MSDDARPTMDDALAAYASAESATGTEGVRLANVAAELFEAAGANPADVANAHLVAAEHATRAGRVALAVACSRRAVACFERQPDLRDGQRLILGDALRAHGAALRDDGQHDAAGRQLARALTELRAVPEHPVELEITCLNDLGILGKFSGRFDDAMAAYLEAEGLVRTLPDPGGWQATLDHNIGGLHHSMGHHALALERTGRALAAARANQPADPVAVARELGALGAIGIDGGDPATAVGHLCEAIDLFEGAGGGSHPDSAAAWSNLGRAHAALGEFAPASEAYEHALKLRRSFCRLGHPDLTMTLNNFAALLIDRGQVDRARELLEEAEVNARYGLAADHPISEAVAANLARVRPG